MANNSNMKRKTYCKYDAPKGMVPSFQLVKPLIEEVCTDTELRTNFYTFQKPVSLSDMNVAVARTQMDIRRICGNKYV